MKAEREQDQIPFEFLMASISLPRSASGLSAPIRDIRGPNALVETVVVHCIVTAKR